VVNDTPAPKSRRPSLLVGFGIRLCLWLLLIYYAIFTYLVGPRIEEVVLDRGIAVPEGIRLAFWTSHYFSVYFILVALLVVIDGAGSLVMALTPVTHNTSRTWSRLMWAPPLFLNATIILGALIGAIQVLVALVLR
jgi:hypothetical protein